MRRLRPMRAQKQQGEEMQRQLPEAGADVQSTVQEGRQGTEQKQSSCLDCTERFLRKKDNKNGKEVQSESLKPEDPNLSEEENKARKKLNKKLELYANPGIDESSVHGFMVSLRSTYILGPEDADGLLTP